MAQNITLLGASYPDVPSVELPKTGGGIATFHDASAADAVLADVLSGKTFVGSSGAGVGTMPNNGAVSGTISTKSGSYTIAEGYHNGSGKVQIKSSEQNKIIAENIKSGIKILGVTGTYEGMHVATGSYLGSSSTKSFTISGLSFTPIGAVVFALRIFSVAYRMMINASTLPVVNPNTGNNIYALRFASSSTVGMITGRPITLNADGFTVSRSDDYFNGEFVYVCWG